VSDLEEALRKAREHADTVYEDKKSGGEFDFKVELANIAASHGKNGTVWSSSHGIERAGAHAKRIDDLVRARLDGLVEGFSMHGVPLDEQRASDMVNELMSLRDALIAAACNSDGIGPVSRVISADQFGRFVLNQSKVSRATVTAEINRRRVMSTGAKENTVTNIYHLTGPGSRVNVNSVDNSTNVTITESQLFSKLREEITAKVQPNEERDRILEKIATLEKEPNPHSLWDRYTELVGVAADHMTLLCPFIPALTEWIKKAIG
jgi:hypothetical protein